MAIASVNNSPVSSPLSQVSSSSSSGTFNVNGQRMTVQDLMLIMTLNSLNSQDSVFENLFQECENRTTDLNKISSIMQIMGKYRDYFDKDGKPIKNRHDDKQVWMEFSDREALKALGMGDLLQSGLVPGLEKLTSYTFTKADFESGMENLKLAQAQVSSVNEQQMMRANQAANKRATILQFGQSLLSTIKEANQASAR